MDTRHNLSRPTKELAGLTKAQIRSKILFRLRAQKEEDRRLKSRTIKEQLFRTAVFKKTKTVMFYIAFDGEVDTEEMIKEAMSLGKRVVVPVCRANRMLAPCVLEGGAKLEKGLYCVKEPAVKKFVTLEDSSLVIVPGIAFDRKGNRLGRGRGYYDNFLSSLPEGITSIGLAFDFQILPCLPATKGDISVDKIIFA